MFVCIMIWCHLQVLLASAVSLSESNSEIQTLYGDIQVHIVNNEIHICTAKCMGTDRDATMHSIAPRILRIYHTSVKI